MNEKLGAILIVHRLTQVCMPSMYVLYIIIILRNITYSTCIKQQQKNSKKQNINYYSFSYGTFIIIIIIDDDDEL